jgi:hypothetical protein
VGITVVFNTEGAEGTEKNRREDKEWKRIGEGFVAAVAWLCFLAPSFVGMRFSCDGNWNIVRRADWAEKESPDEFYASCGDGSVGERVIGMVCRGAE